MGDAPEQNGYNIEMQRVERLARMEVRTTDPYYSWQNKAESVINIIKGKAKRRRIQRNTTKRVWDFFMVWEAEIYSRTPGKDGRPALEKLTGYTIDIYEWLEF